MRPVTWVDGQRPGARRCPPEGPRGRRSRSCPGRPQTRIAIPDRYVGGATGTTWPLPTIWKNGAVAASDPADLLPPDHDAGMVTSITATDQYVLAAGVAHRTGSSPPAYSGVVWLFDLDFTASTWDFLPLPAGSGRRELRRLGLDAPGRGPPTSGRRPPSRGTAGLGKPVVWTDDVPAPTFGIDFAARLPGPPPRDWRSSGSPPTRAASAATATASGTAAAGHLGRGHPVHPALRRSVGTLRRRGGHRHPPRAAPTWRARAAPPTRPTPRASSPSPRSGRTERRTDLGTLAAPGAGPAISGPLFGWWRLPGTPASSPPDWPYPGGTGEVLGGCPSPRPGRAWPGRWSRSRPGSSTRR